MTVSSYAIKRTKTVFLRYIFEFFRKIMKMRTFKTLVLSNGLRIILQPLTQSSSVSVYITVGAGPRFETQETAGLAHFLEHMLFEGTKNLPTSKDVAEYIEKIGGKSGAFTDKEYVAYYAKVKPQHLETAISHLSDILFSSTLNPEAIEKEKGIVMEELKRKIDNPEVEIWDLWLEWIWGENQALGRSTLGNAKTIRNVTREKLLLYMRNLYHPTNMVIAIAGNFSLGNAEKLLRKNFETQSKGRVPNFKTVNLVPKKNVIKTINSDTQQNQLILGFITGVSYRHKDRFPLLVAANILGGGTISRIFHKLVYELGIAYAVRTYAWIFRDTGLFLISGGFSKETEKAIKTILEELTRLKSEKVSSKELQAIKEISKSNIYFYMETSDAIAFQYATDYITENRILTPDETAQHIEKVTAEDIQRVAKRYFAKENLRIIARGPSVKKFTHSFEKLLDNFR